MQNTVQVSSVANKYVRKPTADQFKMPTWGVMVVLILALFIIKTFIYLKDPKRHNQ